MLKFIAIVFFLTASAWSEQLPKINLSTVDVGYIPNGFDSNDQVQLVIEGTYRDTCSKPAGTRFTVNTNAKTIQISS